MSEFRSLFRLKTKGTLYTVCQESATSNGNGKKIFLKNCQRLQNYAQIFCRSISRMLQRGVVSILTERQCQHFFLGKNCKYLE